MNAPTIPGWILALLIPISSLSLSAAPKPDSDPAISFRNDVLPILSKAGCNSGGCHGAMAGKGGFSILLGDSIHNFCDGVIIAAAFLADVQLGIVTALAVVAHEIPQEAGDYIVLLNAGFSRRKALMFNALSGLAAVLGGVVGYFVVGPWESLFPYLLVVASSCFIYVAVADLLPQLQQRLSWRQVLVQVAGLAAGLALVVGATRALHVH